MEKIIKVTCPKCNIEVSYPEHGRTQYVLCPECGTVVSRRKAEPLSPVLPAYVYSGMRRLTEVYKQERNLMITYGAEIIVLGAGSNIRKKIDRSGKSFSEVMEEATSVSRNYLMYEEGK